MGRRLHTLLTTSVTIAAVLVAIAAVHREFFRRPPDQGGAAARQAPTYVEDWASSGQHGILLGDTSAAIKIIEFADLECPFCRRFHATFQELKDSLGSAVALIFVHYPIASHRFAEPAARAAECADAQHRFEDFIGRVFEKQDSLGLKAWSSYAIDAGVNDTTAFLRCLSDERPFDRIERGKRLASRMNVRGTPTIIINGWRYPAPPYESIRQIADSMLAAQGKAAR
jgi:protein-disulfide isomerase